ncbi:MAG TPA: amidase [Burkholderiales bacterium]|nr:amidase [Burkholderiales bacterium]
MKNSDDLCSLSATELLALYRRKKLSPVEVTKAVYERIDALNPVLNAFCVLDFDSSLGDAKASERRWRQGAPLGLLDGVPVSIKDLLLTKGWPTLRGSKTVNPKGPWNADAPCTARLREHGAVILGKTTTPEFGWKGVTDSPLTGITRNPWNPKLTPGGSSGGGAAAVAAGMGPLTVGTDGGGSIRIPCSFTGLFGLKPSFGRVPAWPLSPMGTVAHVGPMTRTVEDAALLLNVLSLPDRRDWHALPWDARDYRVGLEDGVRGLRIAYSEDLGYAQVEPEIRKIVGNAVKTFLQLGAAVEARDPGFENCGPLFAAHWFPGAAAIVRNTEARKRALMDKGLLETARQGEKVTTAQYLAAVQERGALGEHMNAFHEKWDLLVTPTLPLAAFTAGVEVSDLLKQKRWTDWSPFSYPFNLTQQPAATIPCGLTRKGLPVGLHIVGPRYADALVLRAARAFESAHPIPLADVSGLERR